jgi:hypothetical protein
MRAKASGARHGTAQQEETQMATSATSAAAARAKAQAAARAKAAQAQQQQLAMQRAQLGQAGLVSPYDGSNPYGFPATGAVTAPTGGLAGTGRPQVNATNQSALAPHGDVNQHVTNENNYYNIIMPSRSPFHRFFGGLGIGGYGQQPMIDPATGAYLVQRESGIIGWLKRLVRGY